MNSEKVKIFLIFITFFIASFQVSAQNAEEENDDIILQKSIEILKRYFYEENQWYIAKPSLAKNVQGLINFLEDAPVDTLIRNLNQSFSENEKYVFRLPENVTDSLTVPGFYSWAQLRQNMENIGLKLQQDFQANPVKLPATYLTDLDKKLKLVPEGKGMQLFIDSVYRIPANLKIPEVIPDSILNSTAKYNELLRRDSIRTEYIEKTRIRHNDSLITTYVDSVKNSYQKIKFEEEYQYQIKRLKDSVKVNNYNVLRTYNENVVNAVNDSILLVLQTLSKYADFIDTTQISFVNLSGQKSDIMLKNGDERFARIWLKNVQEDSLSVMVKSLGKRSVYMLIDDGVTFSRYKPKQTREFDFKSLEKTVTSLTNVGKSYDVRTPWIVGGDGNVGFSQTYLENWKKGGQSSISSLIVLKGYANYSRADGLLKWVNSAEIRNGWLKTGGEDTEMQKNDDKFEFTSRVSVSAFKKWFYSTELNYETQFFKGYVYPTSANPKPISGFMAPARSFFKVGLEYKPNNEFSLLLSPLTLKNVYVRDTSVIDQTKFGIDADKNSFWEPGLNADIRWKKALTKDITYETKYKMFFNYKAPFTKHDINWENLLEMQLNHFISMRFLVHFIYDDDVLFPIYDDNNVKIGEKNRLQTKEFFSIGFVYKINHKVMTARKIR